MERRPAEAAVRFAWGAPERRNPVAAGASDRIGMRFACHRGGDRECIIGSFSSLRFPMRKLLILARVALMVSGCGLVYRGSKSALWGLRVCVCLHLGVLRTI